MAMNLQQKTIIAFVIALIGVTVLISIFVSAITLSNYLSLEQQYTARDLDQAIRKVEDEVDSLNVLVSEWGPWDDTYDFVNGNKPGYVRSKLLPDTYRNLRLNLIIITNSKGETVYSGAYNIQKGTMVPVPDYFSQGIDKKSPLLNMSDPRHSTAGILLLPDYPVIIASRPIVHTDFSGTPQGVVVMGRYLNPDVVSRLSALTLSSLVFNRLDDRGLSQELIASMKTFNGHSSVLIRPLDKERVAGYALIRDIYGNEALVLEMTQPRSIYRQGINTIQEFIFIIVGTGLCFGLLALYLLNRWVLSRIENLSLQVHTISRDIDLSKRVSISGDDELFGLTAEINRMLETIEKIQSKIQKSESRFRELAELLPLIIFEMDTDARLTYINKFTIEIFGLNVIDVSMNLSAMNFIVPEDHDRVKRNLQRVAGGERELREIYTFVKKDGTRFRAIAHTAPIIHNGHLEGFRGSIIDISERLRLEEALRESEEKYRALAENTGDILFSTDTGGIVTYASPQVNQYGFLVDEMIGQPLFIHVHPEDRQRVTEKLHGDLHEGAQFISTFRMLDKWDNVHWLEEKSFLRLDPYGKPIGIYGILRDITERKRGEDAIELANKKLNLMNNITRHDILNTLTGLLGCVDMANATSSAEERRHLFQDIKDLAKVIQRQIAFTREYQEVGVHLPKWQNIDEVMSRVLPNFEKSQIHITTDLKSTELYADPLLEKVIYNLVDNAIRYGEKITSIKFYFLISDKGLSFICEDDGMGVPPKQKLQIFERGVGRNTGMGLFLTQEILGITGISIVENGVYGEGARFEMVIPRGAFRFGR
jgi:PAS domain S-box-containing protein